MYYVARFFDPQLGRFVSPDTIIPEESQGVQAWDRYAGMNNNPVIFFDRDGHCPWLFLFAITATVGYVTYDTLTTPPKNNPNTPPKPTSADMSEWLIDRIQDSSQSTTVNTLTDMLAGNPIQQVEGLKEWISLVRSTGEWDFKVDIENAGLQGQIVLGGREAHSEAVANLFFGFIGSEVGFDSNILQAGAGAFQLWDNRKNPDAWGGLDTMFDEQFDNWWIRFGIYLHGVIQDDLSRLTKEDLAEILGVYISQNGDPPQKPAEVDR